MTILEVQPGGGWWTEILAPYAHATGGKYYATAADLDNPEISEGARKSRAEFEARFAAKPDVYGQVQLVNFGAKSKPLPENTFDFALSARSVHGWMGAGITEKVFKDLYGALKPGGILAIEQHRANPGAQDPKAESGYVTEAFVIEQALGEARRASESKSRFLAAASHEHREREIAGEVAEHCTPPQRVRLEPAAQRSAVDHEAQIGHEGGESDDPERLTRGDQRQRCELRGACVDQERDEDGPRYGETAFHHRDASDESPGDDAG